MLKQETEQASELMMRFAERTGLSSDRPQQRYLWTDAFAVCNFLGLARATGEERYTELALQLVAEVHHTLGRHRPDDARTGWLSGLDESQGEAHPTKRGLRIGKPLPERGPDEPLDDRLEWDRDGQYFHYLTKWMHALDQVTCSTGQPTFNVWARELAHTAHDAFTYVPAHSTRQRMYWKMSIDLSRPLVRSMGQHDPLDGYITYVQLNATAAGLLEASGGPDVSEQAAGLSSMIEPHELATADPLGLGGLLMDACRVQQLMRLGALANDGLLEPLLAAALAGLQHYALGEDHRLPATARLAFRELGLAIGLCAVALMWKAAQDDPKEPTANADVRALLETLMHYAPLRDELVSFWIDPAHQQATTWTEHQDINEVMLASGLAPEGFLVLPAIE